MNLFNLPPRVPKQNIADGIYAQYIISCSNIKLILRILGFSVKCSSWCCIIACEKLHETLRSHMDHLCIFIADNTCEASVNKNAEIDMFNCKIVIFYYDF